MSFDSNEAGTSAMRWRSDARWPAIPALSLRAVRRVTVVAAHPDDETLGAGGLIAQAAANGTHVTVVVVTDGSGSHHDSPPAELAARRAREVRAAVSALDPHADLILLDFADGGTRENEAAITDKLRPLLSDADLIVSPWRGDGHRDHRVVGEICAILAAELRAELLEYPIWLWHWASPESTEVPWDALRVLALSPQEHKAKAAAIERFQSQIDPSPSGDVMLSEAFLQHFGGVEELFVGATPPSITASYFDALYRRKPDPWGFTDRWYEKRKREITIASLPRDRYRSVLEIGCSIGLLTELLAARADQLLSLDVADAALDQARARLGIRENVTFERRDVSTDFPAGSFDLVVISEVGYYFDRPTLDGLLARSAAALTDDGALLLCHWRHDVADYPLTGDEVHAAAHNLEGLIRVARHDEADFVLDVYSRDGRSVAEQTGLL